MYRFWLSVMLSTGNASVIRSLHTLSSTAWSRICMCERWIKLFGDTCGELFEEPVAEAFRAKATRIAESLKFALSSTCFRPVASGRRFQRTCRPRAERLHYALYVATREQEGREASPTAAIINSQSAKAAQKEAPCSTRKALMRARRSRAASSIFLLTCSAFS
jgi:hypothetical protein